MRGSHVCSVLASLMLLWSGIAAAQKAPSWKTLKGTFFSLFPSLFLVLFCVYSGLCKFISI
jgi:hypothetical protein